MKKQLLTTACFIALVTTGTISYAQTTAMHQSKFNATTSIDYTLSAASEDVTPPASSALPLSAVNPKAVKSFDKAFKGISNSRWYASSEKNTYLATFTSKDGRDARVLFSKNGSMYYAIYYGNEQSLPKQARHDIKANYVDYAIGNVSEVNVDGQKIWVVNLKDDNNLVIAKAGNNGLDEIARYQMNPTDKKERKGSIIIPQ